MGGTPNNPPFTSPSVVLVRDREKLLLGVVGEAAVVPTAAAPPGLVLHIVEAGPNTGVGAATNPGEDAAGDDVVAAAATEALEDVPNEEDGWALLVGWAPNKPPLATNAVGAAEVTDEEKAMVAGALDKGSGASVALTLPNAVGVSGRTGAAAPAPNNDLESEPADTLRVADTEDDIVGAAPKGDPEPKALIGRFLAPNDEKVPVTSDGWEAPRPLPEVNGTPTAVPPVGTTPPHLFPLT